MTLDDYDEDTIKLGDIVKFKATVKEGDPIRYGKVCSYKYGQVQMYMAISYWDFEIDNYVRQHMDFSDTVKVTRNLDEITKLKIEELI